MADGTILTPSTPEQVVAETQVMLLRSMTRSLESVTQEMSSQRKDIMEIKMDVAIVKERQTANAELRKDVEVLRTELDTLKARAQQQDGAMTFATLLKDFGPWAVSLVILFFSLFGGPKH